MISVDHAVLAGQGESAGAYALVADAARRHPDRAAVADRGELTTYSQLGERVDGIVGALVALGCEPGARVCVAASHGVALVAAVLAVLKVGATYVPLDTRSPIARLRYIAADSGATFVAHTADHARLADELGLVRVPLDAIAPRGEPVPERPVARSDLAYILYTSGSTGRPKGVGITHSNLLNYVLFARDRYFEAADDRIALYTTLAFDFTVTCIFPPLAAGASIGIYDGVSDPMAIQALIDDTAVNVIKITPSYLFVLSHILSGQSHVRRLIVGGEDLPADLAARVHRLMGGKVEVINEYGPTEATVGCIVHRFDPEVDRSGSVPIGKPIPGMQAHVLDEARRPVETGQPGELYLSGLSVAPGYVNLEERSRTAFVDNPFDPGTTMYRTGDLVRRDSGGRMHFLGRSDDQVKIRGNRVELSEVSSAVLAVPGVSSAYVTTFREHGTQTLAAVVTGDGLTEAEVTADLRARLPAYMIPTSLKVVPDIPLNSNQKVDRPAVLAIFGRNSIHESH